MIRRVLLCSWSVAALSASVACSEPEYDVVVRFDPIDLAADVARIEVALIPDCAAQTEGEPATGAVRSVAWERGRSPAPLGVVDPGQYGLYARGLGGECGVVASGCAGVTLEDGGESELVVTLSPATGSGCAPGTMCVDGACVGPDGGSACDTAASVAAGSGTACAIGGSGALYCWGVNDYGERGDGTTGTVSELPVRAGTATTWTRIAVGADHACGIQADGSLWCWGRNHHGQLGTGDDLPRAEPTRVGTGTSWVSVRAGDGHTCALDTSDTLSCWGDNDDGELGLGDTSDRNVPQPVPDATFSAFDIGWDHTCGIDAGGAVKCWGTNAFGEIGDGSTTARSTPTAAGTGTSWVALATGDEMTCAIDMDGSLWCWGANDEGQLGNGTYDAAAVSPTPARVGDGNDWSLVAIGDNNACGFRAGASLWCWGDNDMGEVGIGSGDSRVTTPTRIPIDGWSAMDGGEDYQCAIREGALYCWGSNVDGELGLGDRNDRNMPTVVCLPL